MKNIFKILSIGLGLVTIVASSSCASSKHSHRISQIADKNVTIADKIGVELKIDENKVIQASSTRSHKSSSDAKDEAYYNAITNNNIHVLVDPIYKTVTAPKILFFGGKSRSTVTGFAGYYENPRSYKEITDALESEKTKKDQESFDLAIKQMKQLKDDGIIKTSTSSNVSTEKIVNTDKIGNLESLHLTALNVEVEYDVTKSTITTSLVDEYKQYLKGVENPSSVGNQSIEEVPAKEEGKSVKANSFLSKVMFWKKKKK